MNFTLPNSDNSKKFDSVQVYRIRKLLQELSNKTGRGTELVTLYLPPKKAIHEAISALREESGTASNIKSDTTRAHVQDALTKTMQRLRLYKSTPENGLIIFCGAIPGPGGPGKETIELYEVLPNKPVTTYLYRCVAPDTEILLANGRTKSIGELEDSWLKDPIATYDSKSSEVRQSRISAHLETRAEDRVVFKLAVESGRSIVATEDHPFYTPRGWIRLGELKKGDLTCIKPLADLDSRSISSQITPFYDETIVDEGRLMELEFPPANMHLTIKRLWERGLLPLNHSNPKLLTLARILGHLFSDGSLKHNKEMRRGKPYSHFTIDLCVGSKADLEEMRSDIEELGVHLAKSFESNHILSIDGRSYSSHTFHVKLRDTALITLLRALGAPIGSKVKNGTRVPDWIKSSSRKVKRGFLETLMGGDGEAPKIIGSNPARALRLVFHRAENMKDEGLRFLQDLKRLFAEFGISTREIATFPGYAGRDGVATIGIELSFNLDEDNVLKLCHSVGYRYCKRKENRSLLVGEYLRVKSILRQDLREKMKTALLMRRNGSSVASAASTLRLANMTASRWSSGTVANPIVREDKLASYEEWIEESTQSLAEPLVWESITSIEPVKLDRVMDLTTEDGSHSFFANGFLVHNCDDHFHLDPLREMLKEENVVGILSLDATEAGLGIVSGDKSEVVDVASSGVSGKTRKGGQCVSADTLVQLADGKLVPVSRVERGSKIASFNFADNTQEISECADSFSMVPSDYYVIETARPKMKILATGEHRFFTVKSSGVSTMQAFQLKAGDRLLVSRKLPEPQEPSLLTRFPAQFIHKISPEGVKILKEARLKRKLSQLKLAKMLGLRQTEISQLERSARSLTWRKLLKTIAALLGDQERFLSSFVERKRTLPEYFSPKLLELLGYIAGDGSVSKNRVSLHEGRREVAELYSSIVRQVMSLASVQIQRIDKTRQAGSFAKRPYFETRIYSKDFSDGLKRNYPQLISRERSIPDEICKLDNKHLAFFIRGIFDAEGHARGRRIGIGMKSGLLIRQLQLLLLRFGIVSSYSQSVNKFGSTMHHLDVSDLGSLNIFLEKIGFTADDKLERLRRASSRLLAQSYLNVPVMGSWVDQRAKEEGIRRESFDGVTNFFSDTRGVSRFVFRRVVNTFERELEAEKGSHAHGPRLEYLSNAVSELSMIEKSGLILAVVNKVSLKRNVSKKKFVDIELPLTQSFIGNGFVLHNSARRYERLREMELTDYYNRLADHAKKAFLEQYNIKALIVSGPGPTKDQFVKENYLDYRLQKAIIGVLDTGYSGREGVRETIDKSGDLLQNFRIVEERKLVQKFLREVNSDTGLAIYGVDDVISALKRAAVDVVLINDDIDTLYLKATCSKCGDVREKFVRRAQYVSEKQSLLGSPCPKCGSQEFQILEKDVVDYFADLSLDSGARVEIISSKNEDGAMLKSFGGISALLRYKV